MALVHLQVHHEQNTDKSTSKVSQSEQPNQTDSQPLVFQNSPQNLAPPSISMMPSNQWTEMLSMMKTLNLMMTNIQQNISQVQIQKEKRKN